MQDKSLTKLLTEMTTKKFPFVRKVEVNQEHVAFDLEPYRSAWVFLTEYENIIHDQEIKNFIEQILRYTGKKVSTIQFTLDNN